MQMRNNCVAVQREIQTTRLSHANTRTGIPTQQALGVVDPMLIYCWASVAEGGPTLNRHSVNRSCLLGIGLICDDLSTKVDVMVYYIIECIWLARLARREVQTFKNTFGLQY